MATCRFAKLGLDNAVVRSGYLSEIFVSFQGEGAHVGERHLFVRLAGCNIRCIYCDTPGSLERTGGFTIYGPGEASEHRPNPVVTSELRSVLDSILATQGPIEAMAITGGEPLVQAEFLAELLGGQRLPVPVLLETSGVLPQRLREVLGVVDIVSMDIKLPSNTRERSFWEEHAAFIGLARGKELYAKVLVDETTAESDLERAATLLGDSEIRAFLQPITEPSGRSCISAARLDTLYRIFQCRHPNLRVLPQTHKMMGIR